MCRPVTSHDSPTAAFSPCCCFLHWAGAMESQLAPAALDRVRLSMRWGRQGGFSQSGSRSIRLLAAVGSPLLLVFCHQSSLEREGVGERATDVLTNSSLVVSLFGILFGNSLGDEHVQGCTCSSRGMVSILWLLPLHHGLLSSPRANFLEFVVCECSNIRVGLEMYFYIDKVWVIVRHM